MNRLTDIIDADRLLAAYRQVRAELVSERNAAGHWVGELSSSALATATALSALSLVRRAQCGDHAPFAGPSAWSHDALIAGGVRYLAEAQNADGGWGDTDKSYSNISATLLALAAFALSGCKSQYAQVWTWGMAYVERLGGIPALRRRYGKDQTFAAPILANCALAGIVPWQDVPRLPFELACLPQNWYRLLRLPVVSYAIPALVAVGQAAFARRWTWNPAALALRAACLGRGRRVLLRVQPDSGGYLEAVPLTSFVVMCLAGTTRRSDHPVIQRGVEFLVRSARADGSWPIDVNLATWNTTLAINALADGPELPDLSALNWLLDGQQLRRHPYTGAAPGGWAWTDLSGGVPDADDTAGALLALAALRPLAAASQRQRIDESAAAGRRWLLSLQNRDGGWPTFCRGWGTLPFDRSGPDLTAHALRALLAFADAPVGRSKALRAVDRGLHYLELTQIPDGSWAPLWFGNQDDPLEENRVYGTARVLAALRDVACKSHPRAAPPLQVMIASAMRFLCRHQNADGGWGRSGSEGLGRPAPDRSSVEETALAVRALVPWLVDSDVAADVQPALSKGLDWLVDAVETGRHRTAAPVGFYFARLWYYERLYPVTFTVSALGRAALLLRPRPERTAHPTPATR